MAPEPLSPDSAAMKAGAQLVEAVAAYRSIDKTMTVLVPTRKTLLAQAVNLGGHLYAFKEALHLVEMTPAKEALFHVRDDALEAKKECGFEPPAAAMKECALALQVLIERGHPDSLNALFAIRQSGTLTFTATARPVRTP
ncbi:hypothetical protein FB45DRAFT_1042229 [Roridomyces roridus]|uniref:Uncharacterized protein n=1 Tax=Roridomyces roridus TaxID=1738132 RepID=A0AAD7AZK7_9AGAR|nr:hypothetical protein FB45DRAFT_1042229 [Roridomyces roridus]